MLSGGAEIGSRGSPQNHGYFDLAAKHVAQVCTLLANLIHGDGHKIRELQLHHRPHSGDSRTHAGTDVSVL